MLISCCWSLPSGEGDVDHDAPSVVVHVGEAASDTLGLLDDPVEALGAGVGHVLGERDEHRWPPGVDRGRQAAGFLHVGAGGVVVEVVQPAPDLVRLVFGQQQAQAFLDGMRGGDLVGRISAARAALNRAFASR